MRTLLPTLGFDSGGKNPHNDDVEELTKLMRHGRKHSDANEDNDEQESATHVRENTKADERRNPKKQRTGKNERIKWATYWTR